MDIFPAERFYGVRVTVQSVFEGDPRPFGRGFDIGADERTGTPDPLAVRGRRWMLYQ